MNELEKFRDDVEILCDSWKNYTLEERNNIVETLCEWHYITYGKYPREDILAKLTDFVLAEELANKHPDKMTLNEYPIMSMYQAHRRKNKTILTGDEALLDYLDRSYNKQSDDTTGSLKRTYVKKS